MVLRAAPRYYRAMGKSTGILVVALILSVTSSLRADDAYSSLPWKLPLVLDDNNAKVSFEIDGTWHVVRGETNNLSGKASMQTAQDPLSLRVLLKLPVAEFTTGKANRDKKLREIMSEDQFPRVVVETDRLGPGCEPTKLLIEGRCAASLQGKITIRDVSRECTLPFEMSLEKSDYVARGKTALRWADFGVQDPSMLIAKVKPEVTVHYEIRIPAQGTGAYR